MTVRQPTYEEWLGSMARSTSAAAAVFHDTEFRLLLLHATYEDSWQLPGGTVEHGQDPWQALCREVFEETGYQLSGPPQLMGMDWYRPADLDPYAQFLFRGPCIDREAFSVALSSEHDAWGLRTVKEWEPLVGADQAARLALVRDALAAGRTLYLLDGRPAVA